MHLEALKLKQKVIFNKLPLFPEFYLVGGTALTLQIGHRISADFDLFSPKDIEPNLISRLRRVFKESSIKLVLNHSEQLSLMIDEVKVDFVKYKYPLILELIQLENVKIIKVPEIAAMKAHALNYRGTFKDYIDLYFILKAKQTTLKEIRVIAEKKYKNDFNFRLFLEQLIYLKDIQPEKIEFLKEKASQQIIENFFQKEIQAMQPT